MKLLFDAMLLVSALGLISALAGPLLYARFYKKKTESGRAKILIYRPVLVLISLTLAVVGVGGLQNASYNASANNPASFGGEFVKNPYPYYLSQYDLAKVINSNNADVNIKGTPTRVKLIGVDAFTGNSSKEQNNCFAREANAKLKNYLKDKKIELEGDDSLVDKNKENALLRYVIVGDNNINKLMISSGYAVAVAKNKGYKYYDEFLAAQSKAEADRQGLWSGVFCGDYAHVLQNSGPNSGLIDSSPAKKSSNKDTSGHKRGKPDANPHRGGQDGRNDNGGGNENNNDCRGGLPLIGPLLGNVLGRC